MCLYRLYPNKEEFKMKKLRQVKLLIFILFLFALLFTTSCIPDGPPVDGGDGGDGGDAGDRVYPAEWEEMDGAIMVWNLENSFYQPGLVKELAKEVSEVANVYIVVPDKATENTAGSELSSYGGVNMDNIHFVLDSNNNVWVRDFGPWFIRDNDELKILDLDYGFNQSFPITFGDYYGVEVIDANNICLAGGNYISDGDDISFFSEGVYELNPSNVLDWMAYYTGNEESITTDYLEDEITKHIDMWAKLVDKDTFIVGQYETPIDPGEEHYDTMVSNYDILESVKTQLEGEGYTVHTIPQPSLYTVTYTKNQAELIRYPKAKTHTGVNKQTDYTVHRSYTNSFIINGKVLVPSYGLSSDAVAQNLYETVLPGYEVVMIDCADIIDALGAIHCVVHEVPLK